MNPARVLQTAFVLILVLQPTWHWLLPPPRGNGSWVFGLIAAVPLLLVTSGIMAGSVRGMTWGAYLLVLYFVLGIMEAWSNPPQRLMALSQVALTLLYFSCLVLLVRRAPKDGP